MFSSLPRGSLIAFRDRFSSSLDEEKRFDNFLFQLSTFLSALGLFTGLYSVHMYSKHSTVPDLGKVLLLLLYIVSGGTRILCFLLLAAPYLGLFGLMRPLTTVVFILDNLQ